MRSRSIIYILFGLSLFSFFALSSVDNKNALWIKIYKGRIETFIHKNEQSIKSTVENNAMIQRLVTPFELLTTNDQDIYKEELDQLNEQDYTFLIYKKDSLIFWSKALNQSDIKPQEFSLERQSKLIALDNGIYFSTQNHINLFGENFTLSCLLPIKQKYIIESEYLKDSYHPKINIPSDVPLTINGLGLPIESLDNNIIGFIPNSIHFKNIINERILLGLYLLLLLLFLATVHNISESFFKRVPPYMTEILMILLIFAGRYIFIYLGFQDEFKHIEIFNIKLNSALFESTLGDLLINIALFFYIVLNMSNAYNLKPKKSLSPYTKATISIIINLFIVLGVYTTLTIIKSIVYTEEIPFDFENVFRLNFQSFISVLAIIILNFSFFLMSYGLLKIQNDLNNDKAQKIWIPILSVILSIFIIPIFQLEVKTSILILVAFIFIILLDLFSENEKPNIGWIVTWLIILSTFSSTFLYKFNVEYDISQRKAIINSIIEDKNDEIIKDIQSVKVELEKSNQTYKIDSTCTHCNQERIYKYVQQTIKRVHNLNLNYDHFLYFLDKNSIKSNIENDEIYKAFIESEITDYDNVLVNKSTPLNDIYFINFKHKTMPNFLLVFKKKARDGSKLYTELLLTSNSDLFSRLSKYDYLITNKGKAILQHGNLVEPLFDDKTETAKSRVMYLDSYSQVYFHKDDLTILLAKPFDSINKIISLFSYFFSLYIIFILLVILINTVFKRLPNSINLVFNKKPTLRDKIQFSVIAIIVLSFIIIGIVTVIYFKTSTENYHEARLERKTRAIQRDLEHELAFSNINNFKVNKPDQWIMPISEIHRLDINIFDLKGNLISTSEKDILDAGIISKKINPVAYLNLSKMGAQSIQLLKKIGNLTYKVAYTPILNNKDLPMGYLALPYYSKQRKLREDVSGFMGALLNVYVFLLLIASVVAIAVANSITKPISVIGTTLSQFKLMGQNKPLIWHSSDEVGQLINEYNNMIAKLDKSTELLIKSEREGAWREMAKQVAHEIKNPLTPMKLSIQHLNRAIKSDVENKEELINKVSNRLIEQIDVLAEIATEFSNFAKMPKSSKEAINLNDLLSSVVNLFKDSKSLNISLEMTPYDIIVYSDKNQLTRVFNNLISNSIQAIQTINRGKISIYLTKEENMAILQFSDNGIGISEEMKVNIFRPYFTTKNSGTGLGLVMSQKIIEDSMGEIYFESKPDIKTSFFIKLPILNQENETIDESKSE